MTLLIVAGTRPEVIKLAPVIKRLQALGVNYIFVWSGQHYDYLLSRVFFEELGIGDPDVDLEVGSGTHAEQTAELLLKLEQVIKDYKPTIVVAQGDTNTVLAAAISSAKCIVPFAHVEAGLRSWNMRMPEEVNRRVADVVAKLHFAPTRLSALNLLFEGISSSSIYLTGNTIVDILGEYLSKASDISNRVLAEYGLEKQNYILVTVHRAENTDDPARIKSITSALKELSEHYPVVFPLHPRTQVVIAKYGVSIDSNNIKLLNPLGYKEFLALMLNSRVVLTDSGGVQEEAFTLKIPMVILRYNTERPEVTLHGVGVLAGADRDRIVKLALIQAERFDEIRKLKFRNPFGDGRAGERIAHILKNVMENGLSIEEPDLSNTPVIEYRLLNMIDENVMSEQTSLFDILASFNEVGIPLMPWEGGSKRVIRIKRRLYGDQ